MPLRKGKMSVQAVVKEETIQKLDQIAEKETTSRSSIAAKIIEDNIDRYLPVDKEKFQGISYAKLMKKQKEEI